jgi:hypothetical protein
VRSHYTISLFAIDKTQTPPTAKEPHIGIEADSRSQTSPFSRHLDSLRCGSTLGSEVQPVSKALDLDLKKLQARAYHRAEWAEEVLRRFHSVIPNLNDVDAQQLRALYNWMFVPPTLWPFNVQDVLTDCLATVEKGKRLNSQQRLLIDLLPEPPDETICAAVAHHEMHVQKGTYENLIKTQAKYAQNELAIRTDSELRRQWKRIKAAFSVQAYRDHKGVIRRTMGAERNLRPSFSVNLRRPDEVFQAAFDAFCQRWNLYGMQNDKPLLLKLAVNITPYGTLIHIGTLFGDILFL